MEEWRQTNIHAINARTYAPLTGAPEPELSATGVAALRFVADTCAEAVFVNGFQAPGFTVRRDLPEAVGSLGGALPSSADMPRR